MNEIECYEDLNDAYLRLKRGNLTDLGSFIEVYNSFKNIDFNLLKDEPKWRKLYCEMATYFNNCFDYIAPYNSYCADFWNKKIGQQMPPYFVSQIQYIRDHSLLLPLALANDARNKRARTTKNKPRVLENSKYDLCEKYQNGFSQDMTINDLENKGTKKDDLCYTFDAVKYLSVTEEIPTSIAIILLDAIFNFSNWEEVEPQEFKTYITRLMATTIKKYKDYICSDKYKEQLLLGKEILLSQQEPDYTKEQIENGYDYRFEVIQRVMEGSYDPNYQNSPRPGCEHLLTTCGNQRLSLYYKQYQDQVFN